MPTIFFSGLCYFFPSASIHRLHIAGGGFPIYRLLLVLVFAYGIPFSSVHEDFGEIRSSIDRSNLSICQIMISISFPLFQKISLPQMESSAVDVRDRGPCCRLGGISFNYDKITEDYHINFVFNR